MGQGRVREHREDYHPSINQLANYDTCSNLSLQGWLHQLSNSLRCTNLEITPYNDTGWLTTKGNYSSWLNCSLMQIRNMNLVLNLTDITGNHSDNGYPSWALIGFLLSHTGTVSSHRWDQGDCYNGAQITPQSLRVITLRGNWSRGTQALGLNIYSKWIPKCTLYADHRIVQFGWQKVHSEFSWQQVDSSVQFTTSSWVDNSVAQSLHINKKQATQK